MKNAAFILSFLFMSVTAYASLTNISANSLAEKESIIRSGDFGVQIFTTLNEKETRTEWAKKTGTVRINASNKVKKGERIYVMFIFTGAKPDAAKNCDVTAKTQIIKPDGSVYEKIPPIKVWYKKPALPPGILQLGDSTIGLIIERQDLLGRYQVKTIVTDNISKSEVNIETDFEAVP